MSRTKNASRNIIWGVLNKIITLIFPFAIRTIMIYVMGVEYVGLGSLFSSILQVLSFAELGIGGALVFSMYKPMAEGDDEKVCALLNFYRKAYRIIGTVILVVGLGIMPFINRLIASDIPQGINIYALFAIYLLNNVLGYYLFAYKQSLFTASQRVDIVSKIGMVLQLISGGAQMAILLVTHNYYAYVMVIPIITCLNNILVGILTDRQYPQYKCKGELKKEELREIEKKVGGMVFQKIGGIVLTSVDTLVISAFLGLKVLALYQNYYFIITSLFGFLAVIMQSVVSAVGNSIAIEGIEKNYRDFKKFNLIYIWLVSWCTICLLCLYQPFMAIWVGEKNMFGNSMVVLFAIYFLVHKWCDTLYVYQEACGIWWETKFIPLLAAILNLIVNIILVQIIGLPGILISTIVAVIFVYDTGYASVLFKTYFKDVNNGLIKYWLRQILYIVTVAVTAMATIWLCHYFVKLSSFQRLLVNGIICVIVPNIFFVLIWFRLPEFKQAIELVKNTVKKRLKK